MRTPTQTPEGLPTEQELNEGFTEYARSVLGDRVISASLSYTPPDSFIAAKGAKLLKIDAEELQFLLP